MPARALRGARPSTNDFGAESLVESTLPDVTQLFLAFRFKQVRGKNLPYIALFSACDYNGGGLTPDLGHTLIAIMRDESKMVVKTFSTGPVKPNIEVTETGVAEPCKNITERPSVFSSR